MGGSARLVSGLLLLGLLAACGGGPRGVTRVEAPTLRMASGPISAACNRSDRPRANRQLCGCAQAVADTTLTSSDQSLAASFFTDLQKAQDVRQSDRPSNEAFWDRYKIFIEQTERYCAPVA